jgi:glycopeptide antibiotics resistance protein
MADNPILKMLVFFKSKKLKQFKYIKNKTFYRHTSYTLSGLRLVMTKFMSYEEIKNHCLYSRYREEINLTIYQQKLERIIGTTKYV